MAKISFINCIFIFLISQKVCGKAASYDKTNKRSGNNDGNDLIFATAVCRHGDRNIIRNYPTDPYKDAKYWPEGLGELTNVGKEQQYELGEYLRKRYESLLGDGAYSAKKVYIRSTAMDRVLMSAEANLAGLFPPSDDQIWKKNLNWRPVPVHTQPLRDDYSLATDKQCDRYNYLMLKFKNTSSYTNYFNKYKNLITYLEQNAGQKLPSITDIYHVYNALDIERMKFKRIPHWAEHLLQPGGDLERLAITGFGMLLPDPEMRTMKSGYLLKEILDRFTSKTQGTLLPDRTLWMYFAHDYTISNMLISLGLFKLHGPPYASCLFFELYQGNYGPYVQLFYRKELNSIKLPPLNIPGCGTKCPLANWYQIYENVLPTQSYDEECALRDGETVPPGTTIVYP